MTAVASVDDESVDEPVRAATVAKPRWWVELPFAVAFYYVYSRIRDLHGDATEHSQHVARSHGYAIFHLEQHLHLDIEHGTQHLVLHARDFVIALDVFYGTAHFLLTCLVFVGLLIFGRPQVFRRCRNVLAIGTAIGLIVFALYPTMPPRLMPVPVRTIDTASVIGGLWSYNHGGIEHIADPYAAMPSLHIVWSGWVAYVFYSSFGLRSRWRYLFWLYPCLTGFTIIATGVHWTLDLAGGAVVLAFSIWVARLIERWLGEREARRVANELP